MVLTMSADSGPVRASDDQIAAWAEVRPAPVCRTPQEVAAARVAVDRLKGSGDGRLRFLAQGIEAALDWVTGATAWAPVLDTGRPQPNMRELADEVEEAGRIAAGLIPFTGQRFSESGRIIGRGVQELLAWWMLPAYPAPPWLDGDLEPAALAALALGVVGADPATLTACRATRTPFPYDVTDFAGRPGWS